jgi:hypothetical protein
MLSSEIFCVNTENFQRSIMKENIILTYLRAKIATKNEDGMIRILDDKIS